MVVQAPKSKELEAFSRVTGYNGLYAGIKKSYSQSTKAVDPPRSISADVPLANVGVAVPYVIGRRRISQPNVIWYGNVQAVYETTTETYTETRQEKNVYGDITGSPTPATVDIIDVVETKTITTSIPVGFTVDVALGLCLGPGVVLKTIYVDKTPIWQGTVGPGRAEFSIGENDTAFSQSPVVFYGGAFDQGVEPVIETGDFPAHVGVAYIVFRGMRGDTRLGRLGFEIERFPDPLSLGGRNRYEDDINLATAMYDIVTNPWGGAGLPSTDVDVPSFVAAANVFWDEKNMASVLVDRETPATGVLGALSAQGYSVVFQDPKTSKLKLRPIRATNIDYATSVKLSPRNVTTLKSFRKSSWASTTEVLRATFVDRAESYEPTPILVQNVGSLTASGRAKRSSTMDYPYVTRADLALYLASRDLSFVSIPTYSVEVVANRDAADLLPGDLALFDWPEYELWGIPMIVDRVRKNPVHENTVSVLMSQYTLPDASPVFDLPATPYDPDIGYGPVPPTASKILSAPFWLARKAGLVNINSNSSPNYPFILAAPANNLQMGFNAWLTNKPGDGKTTMATDAAYPTVGNLTFPILRGDGFNTGLLSEIHLNAVINPVYLRNYSEAEQRQGTPLLFVGNEIMTFAGAEQTGPGQWKLTGIKRALIDTVAGDHAPGTQVFIATNYFNNVSRVGFDTPLTFAPEWRIASFTATQDGLYGTGATFTNVWVPQPGRSIVAPRPHETKIDGWRDWTTPKTLLPETPFTVSWKIRSRNPSSLVYQADSGESPEVFSTSYQYHKVYFRDSTNTVFSLGATDPEDTVSPASLEVQLPNIVSAGPGFIYVRSVTPHGESVFDDTLPVTVWKGSDHTFRYALT